MFQGDIDDLGVGDGGLALAGVKSKAAARFRLDSKIIEIQVFKGKAQVFSGQVHLSTMMAFF